MISILRDRKGVSIIFIAIGMTVILSMAALVVDVGLGYTYKNKIQRTVEAAALAGAQELPWDRGEAIYKARQYLELNTSDAEGVKIDIADHSASIQVTAEIPFEFLFAKVMGYTEGKASANAKAINGVVSSIGGIKPLAIEKADFIYYQLYTLKEGAGDGTTGNYGVVALGGTGSKNYEENMLKGFSGKVSVGDWIPTETGNMAGSTKRSIEKLLLSCNHIPACTPDKYVRDCPKILKIPVIDRLNVTGRGEVQVVGFAAFYLEGVRNSGGQTEIVGRFIHAIDSGTIEESQKDYGLRAVKLVP